MAVGYKGKEVLITGGLGFIGSSLTIALVKKGARVTIIDNMLKRQGANLFNIEPVKHKVKINFSDIRNIADKIWNHKGDGLFCDCFFYLTNISLIPAEFRIN